MTKVSGQKLDVVCRVLKAIRIHLRRHLEVTTFGNKQNTCGSNPRHGVTVQELISPVGYRLPPIDIKAALGVNKSPVAVRHLLSS